METKTIKMMTQLNFKIQRKTLKIVIKITSIICFKANKAKLWKTMNLLIFLINKTNCNNQIMSQDLVVLARSKSIILNSLREE